MIVTWISRHFKRFAHKRAALFLVSLLLVAACRKQDLSGLQLQPDGEFDGIQLTDSFSIYSQTKAGQAQRSDEAQSFVGRLQSPEFGRSDASLVLSFQYPAGLVSSTDYKSYTVDSVVLYLRPYAVYGNFTDPLPIDIYQTSERIFADSAYYSDDVPSIRPEVIGTFEFVRSTKSFGNETIIVDSVQRAFLFRIGIEKSIGQFLVDGLFDEYDTDDEFKEYFNGIYIKVSEGLPASLMGAIYGFAPTTGESGIRVYLSKAGAKNERLDFLVNASSARYNVFSHDYEGSELAEALIETSSDQLFVQGLSGSNGQLQIPSLYAYGRMNNLALSKAVLELKLSEAQPSYLNSSLQLYLLTLGENGKEYLSVDFINDRARSGGVRSSNTYQFDVTNHIQNIFSQARKGVNVNYGFSIHSQVPIVNGNDTAMTILKSGQGDIKLTLYHTDLTD